MFHKIIIGLQHWRGLYFVEHREFLLSGAHHGDAVQCKD
jgi:putative methionine-R-sulfoxide reductase with GAF domain